MPTDEGDLWDGQAELEEPADGLVSQIVEVEGGEGALKLLVTFPARRTMLRRDSGRR